MPSPALPRTLVDRYELLKVLGEGSQGTVYAGRHLLTHRPVAVKTMRPRAGRSANAEARFIQEARIAAGIRHPNLIEVLDMGTDPTDQTLFIVQPLLVGCSLEDILEKERALSPHTTLEFLVPILGAVARLHQDGVIHRDIKPANIMITRTKEFGLVPVLIDLGVSKMPEGPNKVALTDEGSRLGTPLYMAPEQLLGERGEAPQTDVWSLGVLLYQCLSGELPFSANSLPAILFRIQKGPPPALHTKVRAVSPALSAVVQRAIEPDLAQRFASVPALLGALLSCPTIEPRITGDMLARRHRHATQFALMESHDTLEDPTAPVHVASGRDEKAAEEPVEWVPARIAALVPASQPEEQAARRPEPHRNAYAAAKDTQFTIDSPALDLTMMPAPRPRRRGWIFAGLAVTVGLLAGGAWSATRRPEPTPIPAGFEVVLRTTPRTAWLRLDGRAMGTGELRASLPRDGRVHRLEIGAAGYYGQTVMFRDAPPPREIVLQASAR